MWDLRLLQKAETISPNTKTDALRVWTALPPALGSQGVISSSPPDSLGLQDHQSPLSKGAEPHAVDANQALLHRTRRRASCRRQETVKAQIAGRSRTSGHPRSPEPARRGQPHLSPGSWKMPQTWLICASRETLELCSSLWATQEVCGLPLP